MNELTPIQKLDTILTFLARPDIVQFYRNADQLHTEFLATALMANSTLSAQDFASILSKLEKDGYVETKSFINQVFPEAGETIVYKISFEGEYFILYLWGYEGLHHRQTAESIRLAKVESGQRSNQIWLLWLTILASVGTLAQAIYSLEELYWKYGWFRLH